VALGTSLSCEARLREGRLRRPFPHSIPAPETYHFVCRPDGLDDPVIRALRDWLVERLR
ncbi:MAG: LysR substrate-binding domain-containing protein, partial [Myxococcota bacterium]